jgi:hypothetical protein
MCIWSSIIFRVTQQYLATIAQDFATVSGFQAVDCHPLHALSSRSSDSSKSFKPFEDMCTGYSLISKKSVKHFLCLCSWFLESETKPHVFSLLYGEGGKTYTNKQTNKQTNKTRQNKTKQNKQLMHGAATDQLTELNFLFTNPWWSKMN